MQILLTTFGFFLIFSIYACGNFQKLKDLFLTESLYSEYINNCSNDQASELRKIAEKEYKKLVPPKKNDDDPAKKDRNPNLTRYLHVALLFDKNSDQKHQEAIQQVLKRLIVELYSNEDFFHDARKQNPNVVDSLIDKIVAKIRDDEDGISIKETKELANLELGDSLLQSVLYKMLKGSKAEKKDEKDSTSEGYPSLIDYISFRKKRIIAAPWLASDAILKSIFVNNKTVSEIIKEREALWSRLDSDTTDVQKQAISDEFKNRFINSLPSEINSTLIDFNISKTKAERNN